MVWGISFHRIYWSSFTWSFSVWEFWQSTTNFKLWRSKLNTFIQFILQIIILFSGPTVFHIIKESYHSYLTQISYEEYYFSMKIPIVDDCSLRKMKILIVLYQLIFTLSPQMFATGNLNFCAKSGFSIWSKNHLDLVFECTVSIIMFHFGILVRPPSSSSSSHNPFFP